MRRIIRSDWQVLARHGFTSTQEDTAGRVTTWALTLDKQSGGTVLEQVEVVEDQPDAEREATFLLQMRQGGHSRFGIANND